uniref:uncharacterized protein LOC105350111 n=1 Tax=Fragaria vesca subsp. vesca TaxID=101020 RepID=UPI0005CAFFD3|nr:PREDICTED: uncharacterized protein LOC105350111 [Fragaria vesca subsp. vesca]
MSMIRGSGAASRPSSCAGRMISWSLGYKGKPGKKVTHRNKRVDPVAVIDEVAIDKLHDLLEDTKTPKFLKRHVIGPEVNKRLLEDGAIPSIPSTTAPAKLSPSMLDQLYDKRGKEREKALATTITVLNKKNLDHDDLNRRFVVTLLYRCLHGVKKGSATEMQYALKVISLLSIVVDCQEKIGDSSCYGGYLGLIYPKSNSGYDLNRKKHSAEVLSAAIRSWSFLLTTMEGWRLHQTYWKGAISFFMDLLEHHDDKLVHRAASTALALIFETGSLDKFWNQVHGSTSTYSQLRSTLRLMILEKLEGVKTNLKAVRWYLETLHCPKAFVTICGRTLNLSSVYRLIQLKYLRTFLGDQFDNYMVKEWKLQDIFNDPLRNNGDSVVKLYESTTEKIKGGYFMTRGRDPYMLTAEERKKQRVRETCVVEKAQTQLRAKQRLLSLELKSYD